MELNSGFVINPNFYWIIQVFCWPTWKILLFLRIPYWRLWFSLKYPLILPSDNPSQNVTRLTKFTKLTKCTKFMKLSKFPQVLPSRYVYDALRMLTPSLDASRGLWRLVLCLPGASFPGPLGVGVLGVPMFPFISCMKNWNRILYKHIYIYKKTWPHFQSNPQYIYIHIFKFKYI